MQKYRYLQFPVSLLKNLMINKKQVLNQIIDYGIFNYAKSLELTEKNVFEQLMYCYFRHKDQLPNDLRNEIKKFVDYFELDYDNILTDAFEIYEGYIFNEPNNYFGLKAYQFVSIKKAFEFLGLTGSYKTILSFFQTEIENSPTAMVNKGLVFDFRDNNKTEYEMVQFAFYLAIQSILGVKPYCKTNFDFIQCRAFGVSNEVEISPDLRPLFHKYTARYHREKIRQDIELNWGVSFYSRKEMRGFYIANPKKIKLESLITSVEEKRKKNQIQKLKLQKEQILQHLKKEKQWIN